MIDPILLPIAFVIIITVGHIGGRLLEAADDRARERRLLAPPPPPALCYCCEAASNTVELVPPLRVCLACKIEIAAETQAALHPWGELPAVPETPDPRWRPGPGLVAPAVKDCWCRPPGHVVETNLPPERLAMMVIQTPDGTALVPREVYEYRGGRRK